MIMKLGALRFFDCTLQPQEVIGCDLVQLQSIVQACTCGNVLELATVVVNACTALQQEFMKLEVFLGGLIQQLLHQSLYLLFSHLQPLNGMFQHIE